MISEEINLKTVSSESDLQLWKDVNKLKNSENIIFHEPDLRSTVEKKISDKLNVWTFDVYKTN